MEYSLIRPRNLTSNTERLDSSGKVQGLLAFIGAGVAVLGGTTGFWIGDENLTKYSTCIGAGIAACSPLYGLAKLVLDSGKSNYNSENSNI